MERYWKRNTVYVEDEKNRSECSNNRCNWSHLKFKQKIPELRTGKERKQGTKENSQTGQYTRTAESAIVKVQNIKHGK